MYAIRSFVFIVATLALVHQITLFTIITSLLRVQVRFQRTTVYHQRNSSIHPDVIFSRTSICLIKRKITMRPSRNQKFIIFPCTKSVSISL